MREKQRTETRRRLYHAALEVFCRDGVDSCRIEDIAHRAEVSRAAFYFHFPTKDDVLLELLGESGQATEAALQALPEGAPLSEVFDTFVQGMVDFWNVGERRKLVVDLFAAQMRRLRALAADPDSDAIRAVVARRFELAAARGELSSMAPPGMLADFFLLNTVSAMASWSAQDVRSLDETLRGVVSLFMNGARGAREKS